MGSGRLGHLSKDRSRDPRKQRGHHREGAEENSKTRLASMQDHHVSSTQELQEDSGAPVAYTGEGGHPPAGVMGHLPSPTSVPGKRCKRDAPRAAFVAYKEVVKGHAQQWNSESKSQVEATRSPAADGAGAVTSAWAADVCNRVLGQELSSEDEAAYAKFCT